MKYSTVTQAVWAAGTQLGWSTEIVRHKEFCLYYALSFRYIPYGAYSM